MDTRDEYERQSLGVAAAVVAVGVFAVVVGLTHWSTAARLAYPGRGAVLLGAMTIVAAGLTLARLVVRRRHAAILSAEEDARLSAGQLSTKRDRQGRLGRHLFDVEADRIPDGEAALNAWLDGRAIGPPESTQDPNVVGIYQAADPLLPLSAARADNRPFLLLFGAGTLLIALCALLA